MKTEKEMYAEMLNINEVPQSVNSRLEAAYAALPAQKISFAGGEKTFKSAKSRRKSPLRTALIAAAICCLLATGVFAGQAIYQMMQGSIPFYSADKPAQPIDSIQKGAESYTAEVNQTVTYEGVSLTLENISVDESFINAYFTISNANGLNLDEIKAGMGVTEDITIAPEFQGQELKPFMICEMDGERLETSINQVDSSDLYTVNDTTFKYMMHYAVAETLPQQFTLKLYAAGVTTDDGKVTGNVCGVNGTWQFDVNVDIGETLAATKRIEPQKVTINTQDGAKTLDLRKFTLAPSGCVAVYGESFEAFSQSVKPFETSDGTVISEITGDKLPDDMITLSALAMRDDKGSWLYSPSHGASAGRDFNIAEITGLSADAEAVTFIPIKQTGGGEVIRNVVPLAAGQKSEITSCSGLEITSVEYTDYGLKITSRPYGNVWVGVDFSLCDANGESLSIHGYTASQANRETGEVTTIIGAYNKADIAATKAAKYFAANTATGYELDEANAVTLPLV